MAELFASSDSHRGEASIVERLETPRPAALARPRPDLPGCAAQADVRGRSPSQWPMRPPLRTGSESRLPAASCRSSASDLHTRPLALQRQFWPAELLWRRLPPLQP